MPEPGPAADSVPCDRKDVAMAAPRNTIPVRDSVFRQVYESPASLTGRYAWLTCDRDVREVEELLGMARGTIGAREINWLDIVSSALADTHSREMIARVILGEQKFVNVEAPKAIAGLHCASCGAAFTGLRSFKYHNWAYAKQAMLEVLERMEETAR